MCVYFICDMSKQIKPDLVCLYHTKVHDDS